MPAQATYVARTGELKDIHKFDEALFHPIVEAIKHTTSPLTAALLLFGISKGWQLPALRAYLRARWCIEARPRLGVPPALLPALRHPGLRAACARSAPLLLARPRALRPLLLAVPSELSSAP